MGSRIGITGHRPASLPGGYNWDHPNNESIRSWITKRLRYYQEPTLEGCSGMALGVDQFFAACCYQLKIQFHSFLPCRGQESRWPDKSKRLYKYLLDKAVNRVYVHDGPYNGPGCMLDRNQAMVDWLDKEGGILLVVSDGSETGGTADCLRRAERKGLITEVCNPFDLEGA
jgi:uncharacterized phage-like protein YoqJ